MQSMPLPLNVKSYLPLPPSRGTIRTTSKVGGNVLTGTSMTGIAEVAVVATTTVVATVEVDMDSRNSLPCHLDAEPAIFAEAMQTAALIDPLANG